MRLGPATWPVSGSTGSTGRSGPSLKTEVSLFSSVKNSLPVETIFLSNIDQALVFPVETIFFFEVPSNVKNPSSTLNAAERVKEAVQVLLGPYYFMAGRLNFNQETKRVELLCNNAGVLFVSATSELTLKELGDLSQPNPTFHHLIHRPGLYKGLLETAIFTIQASFQSFFNLNEETEKWEKPPFSFCDSLFLRLCR